MNINSAKSELGNTLLNTIAKKKNEKYLNGLEILTIPPKFRITFSNNLLNNSIIDIPIKIAGKRTAVVSKKALNSLYSSISERNDSINIDGFGIAVCVTQVNSKIIKYIKVNNIVIFDFVKLKAGLFLIIFMV
jgi:hypothetical protein